MTSERVSSTPSIPQSSWDGGCNATAQPKMEKEEICFRPYITHLHGYMVSYLANSIFYFFADTVSDKSFFLQIRCVLKSNGEGPHGPTSNFPQRHICENQMFILICILFELDQYILLSPPLLYPKACRNIGVESRPMLQRHWTNISCCILIFHCRVSSSIPCFSLHIFRR